jgi:hypothetical protein
LRQNQALGIFKVVELNQQWEQLCFPQQAAAEMHIIADKFTGRKKMQWAREGAHHVLQIRAMMASDEWESVCQGAVLSALGAVA